MRNVMEAILHRRAIRRFDARQVEEGALAQILEAGLYAPSAGGGQRPLFVVCQDRELNLLLGKNKRAHSQPRMAKGGRYVSKEQPSIADDPRLTDAFYGAPTVITLFGPKGFLFTPEDCAVAAENMMLAADALGVGSCYIGQGWTAFAGDAGQQVLQKWAIRPDYYAVGLPQGRGPPSRPQAPEGGAGSPGVKGWEFSRNIDRAGGAGTAVFVREAIRLFCGQEA